MKTEESGNLISLVEETDWFRALLEMFPTASRVLHPPASDYLLSASSSSLWTHIWEIRQVRRKEKETVIAGHRKWERERFERWRTKPDCLHWTIFCSKLCATCALIHNGCTRCSGAFDLATTLLRSACSSLPPA
jgi:hypothetical protein